MPKNPFQHRIKSLFADLEAESEELPGYGEELATPKGSPERSQTEIEVGEKALPASSDRIPVPTWPISPTNVDGFTGFLADGEKIIPASRILTKAGKESLQNQQAVFCDSDAGDPAALAMSLPAGEMGSDLLLEILAPEGERYWSEDERLLVETVADQLNLALENAHLFQETNQAREQLQLTLVETERLYKTSRMLTAARDLHEILTAVIEGLQIEGINRGVLYVFELNNQGEIESARTVANWYSGQGETPAPLGALLSGPLLRSQPLLCNQEPAFINDIETDQRLNQEERNLLRKNSIRAFGVIPLWIGSRQFGSLLLQGEAPEVFGMRDVRSYPALAGQMAAAVQNRLLFEQTQVALNQTEELYQASAAFNAASNYEDILQVLMDFSILGDQSAGMVSITLFDRPWSQGYLPEWLQTVSTWSRFQNEPPAQRIPLSDWPGIRRLLNPDKVTLVENAAGDARLDRYAREEYVHKRQARSLLFVPFNIGEQWIGFVTAVFRDSMLAAGNDLRRLMGLAGQAAVAIENIRLFQETRRRNEELAAINKIISAASQSLETSQMMGEVLSQLLATVPYEAGLISIWDRDNNQLHLAAHQEIPQILLYELEEKGLAGTLYKLVYDRAETIILNDLRQNPPADVDQLQNLGMRSYLGVPIESKGKVLGAICLFDKEAKTSNQEAVRLVQAVGRQVGVALENAGLFEQTQQALNTTAALYEASADLNAAQSYQEILIALQKHTIFGTADQLLNLSLFDRPWTEETPPNWVTPIARRSPLPSSIAKSRYPLQAFAGSLHLLSPEHPTIIEDILEDKRLDESVRHLYGQEFQGQSALFVPLVVGGQWIGFLNAVYGVPRKFAEQEIRRLMALANQAAIAVQNLRSLEESRRIAGQLQTAAEIARDTISTLTLDTVLRRAVQLLCDRFQYYHASIFLADPTREYMVVQEATGEAGEEMKRTGHKIAIGSQSVIGQVGLQGEPLVINDVKKDATHQPNPLLPDTQSELGIPLKVGDRIIGALDVQATRVDAFSPEEIPVLQILADQIAVAVDNARSYELEQKAVAEMRELDKLKSQFLANMSHELRTPLNSIIGFSRVILKGIDGPINDLQEQDLNAIYNSGQHLLGLINDVLDLSKIEAGKMELTFEDDVNLPDMINSVLSTASGLIKDKPVELHKQIASDIPPVRADPIKIRQVLLNLLSNAAKFTEQGSITVQADLKEETQGRQEVLISVIDTGPGINQEDQGKLFQPFSQVDGSLTRKSGGTGLGLSICRHLIEMHGGQIGLESTPGEGARFYFSIPVIPGNDQMELPEKRKRGRPIVLCIEDQPQIIQLYERYLDKYGYQVVGLTDPKLAIEKAKQLRPYAITLDVMMPEVDGWQVLRYLKADEETHSIPVLVCTILENQEKGFSLGAADYLMKPILEDDLLGALNRLGGSENIKRILLIDDDPQTLESFENILKKTASDEKQALHMMRASGGFEAIHILRSWLPDVIILDPLMSDLDSFTFLETLRNEPAHSEIPVLILTSDGISDSQRRRLEDFSTKMLQKGAVDETQLLIQLEQALSRVGDKTNNSYRASA